MLCLLDCVMYISVFKWCSLQRIYSTSSMEFTTITTRSSHTPVSGVQVYPKQEDCRWADLLAMPQSKLLGKVWMLYAFKHMQQFPLVYFLTFYSQESIKYYPLIFITVWLHLFLPWHCCIITPTLFNLDEMGHMKFLLYTSELHEMGIDKMVIL